MDQYPIRILLADDDADDRLLFREVFSELKLKTIVATVDDGVQLMDCLANEEMPLPDILFLDLNMPRKNGLECLKEIRSNERLKAISVVIFSTSESEKDMEATFLAGANVYIKKLSDFKELKLVLEKAVRVAHMYQEPPFNKDNFLLRIQ